MRVTRFSRWSPLPSIWIPPKRSRTRKPVPAGRSRSYVERAMAPRTEESEQRLRAGVESASPDEGLGDRRSEPNAYDEGRLLHELSVYQSELESQNEQLRQAQIELE